MTAQNSQIFGLSRKQLQTFHILEASDATEILYGGAAGGGKSFFGCFWQIYRRLQYAGTRGLIGRSKLKNLKQTTLKTFFDVHSKYFAHIEGTGFKYNSIEGFIKFDNGSEIMLKDLFLYPSDPDFTSLGSLEITDAFIDESTEISEKAFSIVNSRIRYKLAKVGGVPKILLTANPAHNWVKFRFVMNEQNQPVTLKDYQKFISAKVSDNPDKEFKRLYTSQLEKLPLYDRRRLKDGDWAIIENKQPFFYEFKQQKHVARQAFHLDPLEPVWISFDFNIKPTTAIVGQKITGKGLYIYKVYQEDGGTTNLCQHLKQYADSYILKVTGDHSGHSGNTAAGKLPGGQYNTDYHIIKSELNLSNNQLIGTQKANKMHTYSRRLCNQALFRCPLHINKEGCESLVNDLQTAQPTSAGKLLKDRDNHKQDAGDAFRYLINAWFLKGAKGINQFCNLLTT